MEYNSNDKDKDKRPILDSGSTHSVTPYINQLINKNNGNFGQLRGVTGITTINQSGTLISISGSTNENVLFVPTVVRPLIDANSILSSSLKTNK